MTILKNQSIQEINSFGIDLNCDIIVIKEVEELELFLSKNDRPFYVIGGGSNILFTSEFEDLLLKNELKGIEIFQEANDFIDVAISSGEIWHDLVLWALDNNYYGIENLSLIPGTVGAAPMQNIGAYGVEIKDVLLWVEYLDYQDSKIHRIDVSDCKLGYRDSIFKNELQEKCFITKVGIQLSKTPKIASSYGAIQQKLSDWDITNPSPQDISNAIINIRQAKLPDPQIIGNAGSFFKNVMVEPLIMAELKAYYPDIPHYPTDTKEIKIPTAWLIDQCGWKGKRIGNVGTHVNHALVLVNYGDAKGEEILELSKDIQQIVWEKFSIEIVPEVNIVS